MVRGAITWRAKEQSSRSRRARISCRGHVGRSPTRSRRNREMSRLGLVCVLAATVSCNRSSPPPAPDFEKLTDEFTFGTLAISPVTATQTGYHEHNGAQLDEALDDYSAPGIEAQRRF